VKAHLVRDITGIFGNTRTKQKKRIAAMFNPAAAQQKQGDTPFELKFEGKFKHFMKERKGPKTPTTRSSSTRVEGLEAD